MRRPTLHFAATGRNVLHGLRLGVDKARVGDVRIAAIDQYGARFPVRGLIYVGNEDTVLSRFVRRDDLSLRIHVSEGLLVVEGSLQNLEDLLKLHIDRRFFRRSVRTHPPEIDPALALECNHEAPPQTLTTEFGSDVLPRCHADRAPGF